MDADELSALTDAIHRAWKLQDGITLHHLIRQLDGDQLVVIVNPKFHDPTVIVGSITDVQTLLQGRKSPTASLPPAENSRRILQLTDILFQKLSNGGDGSYELEELRKLGYAVKWDPTFRNLEIYIRRA